MEEPSAEPEIRGAVITNPVEIEVVEETADLSGYQWLYDDEPAFSLITLKESIRLFSEKGSGILVYSSDTCPWCNRAMPVLNEVLKEYGVKAYYVDTNMRLPVMRLCQGSCMMNCAVTSIRFLSWMTMVNRPSRFRR